MFVNRALSGLACLVELLSFCPDSEKQRRSVYYRTLYRRWLIARPFVCMYVIVFNFNFKHAFKKFQNIDCNRHSIESCRNREIKILNKPRASIIY